MYIRGLDMMEYAVTNKLWSEELDLRLIDNWIDDSSFELHMSRLDDKIDGKEIIYEN